VTSWVPERPNESDMEKPPSLEMVATPVLITPPRTRSTESATARTATRVALRIVSSTAASEGLLLRPRSWLYSVTGMLRPTAGSSMVTRLPEGIEPMVGSAS
jgi:hypothetical protein